MNSLISQKEWPVCLDNYQTTPVFTDANSTCWITVWHLYEVNPCQKQISLLLACWIRDRNALNIYWDTSRESWVTGSVLRFIWHTWSAQKTTGNTERMFLRSYCFLFNQPPLWLLHYNLFLKRHHSFLSAITKSKVNISTQINTIKRKGYWIHLNTFAKDWFSQGNVHVLFL